ncbi:nucleotide sugar dehydrogenase [Halobacterium litoreum]|uniref:UDP-N-acetyl-D-mannosamine dehydrogenase n=1 Tax=Halobacterium litoreum TaxID=2039234 RepID=A0ABD5NBR3_9EURY|nr:nucleotide sugar dehydrogenase [Halobacterium litoreum]UHH14405.1 nucleotide sugar dehydrogenase [Halobacterium litoreum]
MSATTELPGLYGADATTADQRDALTGGDVPVAVYGLGKMGLPLAAAFADVTGNVVGADVDPDVVDAVNAGDAHVVGEPGLDELVTEVVDRDALRAVADPTVAADWARVHVVIVPTLVTDESDPDLSVVRSVARDLASGLDAGDTVLFESTLPPRTCEDDLLPLLEAESGLSRTEFGLAFCPERTLSGRALADIRDGHPKVVGGVDDESTRVAELVYGELTDQPVVAVSDATTAEAVKVYEGVYRDVNIALANELARHADDLAIDVTEAIEAANTQPYCELHEPGAGVGGHCIPYYPHFLTNRVEGDSPVVSTARDVNDAMPAFTANLALDGLASVGTRPEDADVLVLGLTYRPGVEEIRATPALGVVETLADAGATVTATDPLTPDAAPFEDAGATVESVDAVADESFDAVVLVTQQDDFDDLDVAALGPDDRPVVVADGRQELTELRDDDAVVYRGVGLHE